MSGVSLCMIVKNEESILEKALQSISGIADEIIIVDTGSSDLTVEIARKFTDKIYHFGWIDDFSAARNFVDSKASMDYICRWDADWILRPGDLQKILKLKQANFDLADIIYFKWNLEFNDELVPIQSEPYYFLYKRGIFEWQSPIHNELVPLNPVPELNKLVEPDIEVDHLKDPEIKKNRYLQTHKILQKSLAENNPNYPRLLYFYIQDLMFSGEFGMAIEKLNEFELLSEAVESIETGWVIEQKVLAMLQLGEFMTAWNLLVENEAKFGEVPKFVLIYADVAALIDQTKAAFLYRKYLGLKRIYPLGHSNPEREEVHPRFMLANLLLETSYQESVSQLLVEVVEKTSLPEIENQARILLTKITDTNTYENQGNKNPNGISAAGSSRHRFDRKR